MSAKAALGLRRRVEGRSAADAECAPALRAQYRHKRPSGLADGAPAFDELAVFALEPVRASGAERLQLRGVATGLLTHRLHAACAAHA